jgi:hypothetical protein
MAKVLSKIGMILFAIALAGVTLWIMLEIVICAWRVTHG